MKKLLSILLMGVLVLGLTGCGGSSNKISDKLNEVVKDSVDSWEEKEYAHTFSISDIQSSLNDKGYNYTIIASGDKEFTSTPTDTKYTENIENYDGELFSNTRMMEKDMDINYCLVLDNSSKKYYSIAIGYKTTKLNDVDKEYPYFENDKELK